MNWQPIWSHEDVERLLKHFGGFRKCFLREVHLWKDQHIEEGLSATQAFEQTTTVLILLQRQEPEPLAIEMLFQRVQDFHLGRISTAITFDFDPPLKLRSDGIFYWMDINGSTEQGRDTTWVTAQALSWRDVSDGDGEALRYGSAT